VISAHAMMYTEIACQPKLASIQVASSGAGPPAISEASW
jgi:hypothetical protein